MQNREPYKLGEIINLKRGYDLPERIREKGEYPIVSSSGISGYHNQFKVTGPSVVTGRYGTLGIIHFVEGKNWPLNTTLYVKDFKGNDPKFIYYFLQTLHLEEFNGAAAVPGLDRNVLHRIRCLFPKDAIIQQRIASILSAYDDLIEVNNQRIKLLEETAREFYKEWFIRMRFPGYKQAKFVKGIPKKWTIESLKDHITIVRGKSYTSEEIDDNSGDHAFINLKNMKRNGGFRLDGTKFFSGKFKKEQVVMPGDIVMAITDMTQDRLIVGRVARVPLTEHKEYVISLDIVKIVSTKLSNDFIYSTLRFNYYGEHIAQFANGTNVLHLNPELLRKESILIPDEDLIKSFVQIVKPMFELVDVLAIEIEHLRQIRDRLLPRLISGKLEVNQIIF